MNDLMNWINARQRMAAYYELAAAAGCAWQQIPKWLATGYVPIRRVAAVSRVTGIPADELNPLVRELRDAV